MVKFNFLFVIDCLISTGRIDEFNSLEQIFILFLKQKMEFNSIFLLRDLI